MSHTNKIAQGFLNSGRCKFRDPVVLSASSRGPRTLSAGLDVQSVVIHLHRRQFRDRGVNEQHAADVHYEAPEQIGKPSSVECQLEQYKEHFPTCHHSRREAEHSDKLEVALCNRLASILAHDSSCHHSYSQHLLLPKHRHVSPIGFLCVSTCILARYVADSSAHLQNLGIDLG